MKLTKTRDWGNPVPIHSGHSKLEARTRCEARAAADAKLYTGLDFLVPSVTGYYLDTDDQGDVAFDPPVLFRLDAVTTDHWCDDWLDPYWDLSATSNTANPAAFDLRSPYTCGPSIELDTGRVDLGGLRLADTFRNRRILWWRWGQSGAATHIPFAEKA